MQALRVRKHHKPISTPTSISPCVVIVVVVVIITVITDMSMTHHNSPTQPTNQPSHIFQFLPPPIEKSSKIDLRNPLLLPLRCLLTSLLPSILSYPFPPPALRFRKYQGSEEGKAESGHSTQPASSCPSRIHLSPSFILTPHNSETSIQKIGKTMNSGVQRRPAEPGSHPD